MTNNCAPVCLSGGSFNRRLANSLDAMLMPKHSLHFVPHTKPDWGQAALDRTEICEIDVGCAFGKLIQDPISVV